MMNADEKKTGLVVLDADVHEAQPESREADPSEPAVGKWYWVKHDPPKKGEKQKPDWFGCITHIGSNYVEMTGALSGGTARIHFDNFEKECRFEPKPEEIIRKNVDKHKGEAAKLMHEVKEVTARLSVSNDQHSTGSTAQALAVHSGNLINDYKKSLVRAKEKTLPDLFEKIKEENEAMGMWMKAELIPLKAQVGLMKPLIKVIENRIFSVELYAGLTEEVVQILEGKAADPTTPVHLFQRRHYMDEECLAQYETGGMTFASIGAFDKWMAKETNFTRLLPHPRCIVAFQVRRHEKEYDIDRDFGGDWRQYVSFALSDEQKKDKLTFLYMRNGEQLYRLSTGIEFGKQLFPDLDNPVLNSKGMLYFEVNYGRYVDDGKLITELDFNQRVENWINVEIPEYEKEKAQWKIDRAEYEKKEAKYEKEHKDWERRKKAAVAEKEAYLDKIAPWKKTKSDNGYSSQRQWPDDFDEDLVPSFREKEPAHPHPHVSAYFEQPPVDPRTEFVAFTPASVHYDDVAANIQEQIDAHNRLVLVLQGLFDRSPVFIPHPPAKLWTPEGFSKAISLVYDDSRGLVAGAKPDFEAYHARMNSALAEGCVTIGQETVWTRVEAAKENKRRQNRGDDRNRLTSYKPHGDPGPGKIAKVFKMRGGKCVFVWGRERTKGEGGPVPCELSVETKLLFNISAYTPGDFKQFFADHRTRAEYLRWAPMLLEAEEYWAGKRKIADPVVVKPEPRRGSADPWVRRAREEAKRLHALHGKAVRLSRVVTTRGGEKFEKGELGLVHKNRGDSFWFSTSINEQGKKRPNNRSVNGISADDFVVDEEVSAKVEERRKAKKDEVDL